MKSAFKIFCLILVVQYSSAQKILIPYRSGKLFGLCDENKKIVCKPTYAVVQWVKQSWFKTSRTIEVKDSFELAPQKFNVRNTTLTTTGLINNGKVILDNEPFDAYDIISDKCIIARCEGKHNRLTKQQMKQYGNGNKFLSLFNLRGENLYPDNFKMIRKVDTAGSRYLLFWTVGLTNKHSLFVYDAAQQKISDWLVKDVNRVSFSIDKMPPQHLAFATVDSNNRQEAFLIDFTSGQFIVKPTSPAEVSNLNKDGDNYTRKGNSPRDKYESLVEMSDINNVTVEPMPPTAEGGSTAPPAAFQTYFSRVNDSLYYTASKRSFKRVLLPADTKVLFLETPGITQYQPVIVKNNQQFYIVSAGQFGVAAYDSLIYFGNQFLAWKKVNGHTKAGVITNTGEVIIPFQYDSLYAGIRYLNLVNTTPGSRTAHYQIRFKEADSKYNYKETPYKRSYTNHFTVFVNGRCGVITITGDTVIPFNYEIIARNGLEHSLQRVDNFIVLKQNNRYGITSLEYDRDKKREKMSATIAPVFEYLPAFYYKDYYNVKNYRLIGLYDTQFEFMGYGNEKGKVFYDGD